MGIPPNGRRFSHHRRHIFHRTWSAAPPYGADDPRLRVFDASPPGDAFFVVALLAQAAGVVVRAHHGGVGGHQSRYPAAHRLSAGKNYRDPDGDQIPVSPGKQAFQQRQTDGVAHRLCTQQEPPAAY